MPKYAQKRDDNEREIIQALEAVGAQVWQLNETDIPDLLVGFRRQWFLLEVKGQQGKLQPGQKQFFEEVMGPAAVVRTQDEALEAIGAFKEG